MDTRVGAGVGAGVGVGVGVEGGTVWKRILVERSDTSSARAPGSHISTCHIDQGVTQMSVPHIYLLLCTCSCVTHTIVSQTSVSHR